MRKGKKILLPLLFLIFSSMIISACSVSSANNSQSSIKNKITRTEFINEKVSYYTHHTFRFVEKLDVTNKDNQTRISVSLIPEVGSFPIKEDIYRSLADYAWSINQFFPEISSYDFKILWDDKSKKEAIHATIDINGVKNLNENYNNIILDHNNKLDHSYKTIFTKTVESDFAEKWLKE
ncbi:hypothetical protein J2T13_001888 [Paenibacillus sp. DS2015]|uniref:hypothetical protein n=1 Tax=Paenibacillus sp. DS2015 TaxID=3373917 RepID=UPI003D1CA0EB